MNDLLRPGSHRSRGVADERALVAAALRVEEAWARALVTAGIASEAEVTTVSQAARVLEVDVPRLAEAAEAAGNVVVPLVAALRARVAELDPDAEKAVHRGLTSQDVLDSALMLLARDAVERLVGQLRATGDRLCSLAALHRDDVMAGRTLTQWAVPTTFGLKAAQWLAGVGEALTALEALRFPVQYGGAAGTRALLTSLSSRADQDSVAAVFATELGLAGGELPWHTRRRTVTVIGDALVAATDSLGVLAADVLQLGRPEIAEVREHTASGRGGSSTMPHKQNPVLSVLVSAAASRAPLLGAQLHLAAAHAVDERPDGAWHSEWPAFAELLELAVTAGSQAAELVDGLVVDTETMARRADSAAAALLAERGDGSTDVRDYLGQAGALVDRAVAQWEARDARHG